MKNLLLIALVIPLLVGCATTAGQGARDIHEAEKIKREAKREAYILAHPKLPVEVWAFIKFKGRMEPVIGLSTKMVKLAKGKPGTINVSVGSWGRHEQWIYGTPFGQWYYYFENGVLTSWQN